MKKTPRHSARSRLGVIALMVFGLLIAGGTTAFASLSHNVTLDVDGDSHDVRMFGGTVADVLESNDVDVGDNDELSPAPDTKIADTDHINVRYAKKVDVTVDGEKSSEVIHASTVGEALDDLDIETSDQTHLSDDKSTHVPRSGYDLVVSNPKDVTVSLDGDTQEVNTAAPTVEQVLDDAGLSVKDGDEVKPGKDSLVKEDQKLKVVRVENVERHEQVDIDAPVKVVKDDSIDKGEKKVVKKGSKGKAFQHVDVELADGKTRDRTVLSSKTFDKPQTRVVHKGTKEKSDDDDDEDSDDSDDSDDKSDKDFGDETGDSVWDKIAECESGGDWHINTGNGYYGGLQFSQETWKSVGGSGRPDEASREEQIKRAKTLQKKAGWGQWGCAHARHD